jgi:hypothetical protein
MKASDFDWRGGRVTAWKLSALDEARPLSVQADDLNEDMAQIEYSGLLIDIGWHPDSSPKGSFLIMVIRNEDWEAPLMKKRGKSLRVLRELVVEAIACVESHLKEKA